MLTSCERVTTLEDAKQPILTPLLPVKGLRRDASGALTKDALMTIQESVRSLGVDPGTEQARDAILFEAKQTLCRLHNQYSFLVKELVDGLSRGEAVSVSMVDAAREKNQAVQDILSLSRFLLETAPKDQPSGMVEAFVNPDTRRAKTLEGFQTMMKDLQADMGALQTNRIFDLQKRQLEDSEEKNTYAARMLSLYGFLNVVAIGLLLYISSGN